VRQRSLEREDGKLCDKARPGVGDALLWAVLEVESLDVVAANQIAGIERYVIVQLASSHLHLELLLFPRWKEDEHDKASTPATTA
jgi:hypothetical protein